MAAPDVPTLYDFESAFENAAANYFTNTNAFSQVLTPRSNITDNPKLVTPRVTVVCSVSGTGDSEQWVPSSGANYYWHKTGTLAFTVATQRSSTQNHGNLRGRVRAGLLEYTHLFNANTLPYYQTLQLIEQSSSQQIDAENDEIITQLTYALEFAIPPQSWP